MASSLPCRGGGPRSGGEVVSRLTSPVSSGDLKGAAAPWPMGKDSTGNRLRDRFPLAVSFARFFAAQRNGPAGGDGTARQIAETSGEYVKHRTYVRCGGDGRFPSSGASRHLPPGEGCPLRRGREKTENRPSVPVSFPWLQKLIKSGPDADGVKRRQGPHFSIPTAFFTLAGGRRRGFPAPSSALSYSGFDCSTIDSNK